MEMDYIIYRLSENKRKATVMYWTGRTWHWEMPRAMKYATKSTALLATKKAFKDVRNKNNPPTVVPIPRKVSPIAAKMD